MFDISWPAIIVALVLASPLLLWVQGYAAFDQKSFGITAFMGVIGITVPLIGLGDPALMWELLLAQTLMFASFASISWVRQRHSLSLIGFVSVFSNGGWFIAMHMLSVSYILSSHKSLISPDVLGAFAMVVIGTLVGRMVAVQWTRWAGALWGVKTTEVHSPMLRLLDSWAVIVSAFALFLCLEAYGIFKIASMFDVCVVMMMAIAQNTVYTVNSRFANRDHPGWPLLTGPITGLLLYGQWLFIGGHTETGGNMPFVLMIPYTVATVAGSIFGSQISMNTEARLKMKVATAESRPDYSKVKWHYGVFAGLLILGVIYAFSSLQLLGALGWQAEPVHLPFAVVQDSWYERPLFLLLAGLPFFVQNFTHTLSSRAGSRSNSRVHAVTCLLHGTVYFASLWFVIANVHVVDFLPLAVLGGTFGQFLAQYLSKKYEGVLKSYMDEPPPILGKVQNA
ncbi:hypothetical protein HZC00_00675 [Candidatus Kaiserbacteria bacterium]|nr:hypothetical protein [Candidatus Kaiserbacteria bacterium]